MRENIDKKPYIAPPIVHKIGQKRDDAVVHRRLPIAKRKAIDHTIHSVLDLFIDGRPILADVLVQLILNVLVCGASLRKIDIPGSRGLGIDQVELRDTFLHRVGGGAGDGGSVLPFVLLQVRSGECRKIGRQEQSQYWFAVSKRVLGSELHWASTCSLTRKAALVHTSSPKVVKITPSVVARYCARGEPMSGYRFPITQ